MSDKTKYLLQGIFFLIVAVGFLGLSTAQLITRKGLGAVGFFICLVIGIVFIKNSIAEAKFEKRNEKALQKKEK